MGRLHSGVIPGLAGVGALLLGGATARVSAQAPSSAPTKSVYGTLLNVDSTLNNLLMKEDAGATLAWHFEAPVIAEAARFKPGDPLIVIYRQTSPKQKRVTAIAFPGTAKSPIYLNLTGDRVVIRSAAGVAGSCDQTSGAVSETARQRLRSAVAQAAGGEAVRYRADLRRSETDVRTIDISLTPIRDETGKVIYIVPEGRETLGK